MLEPTTHLYAARSVHVPRLGLISQWYDPEIGSAGVPGSIARALTDRGHRVDVLTGIPNYPSGKVYPGYRIKPYQTELLDKVHVHRVALYPSHDSRPLHRATNFLTFAASATASCLRALGKADVILVYSTPATVAIPAMALRAVRRIPYVLLIQDMWPQTLAATGMMSSRASNKLERLLHVYCDATYRRAEAIAVTSPGMVDLVTARGVDRRKVSVITNWADEEYFYPEARCAQLAVELGLLRPFTAMYAGNIGEVQGLETVIDAATILRDHPQIGFALVGEGVAKRSLRGLVHSRGLTNVQFIPPQPVERMSAVLSVGDVQIISLRDLPIFDRILPSKVQATLAAGRPIIGAVAGDAASVIRASGAGVVVPPGSARQLADAVLTASQMSNAELHILGAKGREYYVQHLSQQNASSQLSELLSSAASRGKAKR